MTEREKRLEDILSYWKDNANGWQRKAERLHKLIKDAARRRDYAIYLEDEADEIMEAKKNE